jgi:hypothetical protein
MRFLVILCGIVIHPPISEMKIHKAELINIQQGIAKDEIGHRLWLMPKIR